MGNGERGEEKEKGFVVKDKRFSAKKEDEQESKIKEEAKTEEPLGENAFLKSILLISFFH